MACSRKLGIFAAALVAMVALSGCRDGELSPTFEAFSRNKLAVLARNVETARDAQTGAAEQITSSIEQIKKDAWTGADPAQAFDLARRLESSCKTRVRSAHDRIKSVEF